MDFVTVSTGLILPYWMGLPIRYIHDEFRDESMKLNEAYKVMGVPCLDCNPLDMSFDGVHLSEKGHKELGIKIAEYMKRL